MARFSIPSSVLNSSKRFPLLFPALLLAGAALVAGCHRGVSDPNDPKFIVAEKGSWQITEGELEVEVSNYLKEHQATPEQVGPAKMPIVRTAMLRNMVLKKLILDQAAALPAQDSNKEEAAEFDRVKGGLSDAEFDVQLKAAGMTLDEFKQRIHEKILVSKVLETEVFKDIDPTDQEIGDFYLKNKDSITTPPEIRASRVLIRVDEKTTPEEKAAKKAAIDKARARVVHGEDFGKVAAEVSEDVSSAAKGGDLGFFPRNVSEAGFDDVAFNTKVNTVSPVFETAMGYEFVKVTDSKPGGEASLADIRPKIAAYLRNQKMVEESETYAKKLLTESGVAYHMVLVDPPAQQDAGGALGAPDSAPAPAPGP
ncbi:MAG TPA: peptidylprolyl isomerase [Candidatus Methylacidiphilales bacterium]|nr:peptidylprolyl isomerase [Candidatus Methylacidiphilales bacterium]